MTIRAGYTIIIRTHSTSENLATVNLIGKQWKEYMHEGKIIGQWWLWVSSPTLGLRKIPESYFVCYSA